MRTIKLGSALAVAFVIGCMTSTIAPFPLVHAQADDGSKRWEYECLEHDRIDLKKEMDKLGADGWELAAASPTTLGSTWCFKRAAR
jgi:hypothetical protein